MSPWERRERGGLYYTRSRKVGGRITRQYVGTGPVAELAAQIDMEARQRREKEAAQWEDERERLKDLAAPVEELCEFAEVLTRATLLAEGFHRHNRGEWRKRREAQS